MAKKDDKGGQRMTGTKQPSDEPERAFAYSSSDEMEHGEDGYGQDLDPPANKPDAEKEAPHGEADKPL